MSAVWRLIQNIGVNGEIQEQVACVSYLGHVVTDDGRIKTEFIKSQMTQRDDAE